MVYDAQYTHQIFYVNNFYKKVLIAICVTKQKIVNKTPIAKDVSKSLLATYDNTKTTSINKMTVLNIVYS